jgi:hypothetical protein
MQRRIVLAAACAATWLTASRGALAQSTSRQDPFEQTVVYLDDNDPANMWGGVSTSFVVPSTPSGGEQNTGFKFVAAMGGTAISNAQDTTLEVGVIYGVWPGVAESTPGRYLTWMAQTTGDSVTYAPPVVIESDHYVEATVWLTGVQGDTLTWSEEIAVDHLNILGPYTFTSAGPSSLKWNFTRPTNFIIHNIPTLIDSCWPDLPPEGSVLFQRIRVSKSYPSSPLDLQWFFPVAGQLVRFGTPPGTPGLLCSPWGTDQVTLSFDPVNASASAQTFWPTLGTETYSSVTPTPVPSLGSAGLVALAAGLAAAAALVLRKKRA